jgi:transposase InsO family protein
MNIAHEFLLQGHLWVSKTLTKIQNKFYWPGIAEYVSRFCQSCDLCQKTVDKGRVKRVPLGRMPLIGVPFERVAIDLVGPLSPPSERGHQYILTIVDYATRYLEAIPLKQITTPVVAEALITVYSRVGFPKEVLSDLGTQFVSELMREVSRLLSIKQLSSTRYHPICNGLVERYNGVIKKVLRKLCAEQPRQWDRFIPALLFALREIPNSSLGYSPFQLLYGRDVRGPLAILREIWTGEGVQAEAKTEYNYVLELRDRLEETWKLATESLAEMSRRYKRYSI